jgi:hypothetical protein
LRQENLLKTMNVREFLRGEYRHLSEPTLVMSYSRPVGIWQPVDTSYSFNVVEWGSIHGVEDLDDDTASVERTGRSGTSMD